MDILEIKNVAYSYANSKEKVLSGVNQKFELGKFYAIVGKSGTGKSTLLSLLAGLDKPQTGKILFKNEDIQKKGYSNHRKNNISLVFQNYNLIDYLSPIENIRLVNKSADESILFELGLDKKQIKRNVSFEALSVASLIDKLMRLKVDIDKITNIIINDFKLFLVT